MASFKLVLSDPKTGKSVQREAKEDSAQRFIGLKLGDTVKGELIDLTGFEFLLTGGSDYCGFPMRKDVNGIGRKRILAVEGVGIKKQAKGIKQRKTVCGNTVHDQISQINLKVTTSGKEDIFSAVKKDKEDTPAEKKEAKEEKKEVAPEKKEEVKEEKKEEAPKEENKETAPEKKKADSKDVPKTKEAAEAAKKE